MLNNSGLYMPPEAFNIKYCILGCSVNMWGRLELTLVCCGGGCSGVDSCLFLLDCWCANEAPRFAKPLPLSNLVIDFLNGFSLLWLIDMTGFISVLAPLFFCFAAARSMLSVSALRWGIHHNVVKKYISPVAVWK
jgi:hypothetical protein